MALGFPLRYSPAFPSIFLSMLTDVEIFAKRWTENPETGCWEWTFGRLTDGYGRFMIRGTGREDYAHRVAWEMVNGPIPKGFLVCHECDVRNCVNPDHLFLGTTKDNVRDSIAKGRFTRGERQWNSRLTETAVRSIRSSSRPPVELAEEYDVTESTIYNVLSRRTWKHVE